MLRGVCTETQYRWFDQKILYHVSTHFSAQSAFRRCLPSQVNTSANLPDRCHCLIFHLLEDSGVEHSM